MNKWTTDRGFNIIEFKDSNNVDCSIQIYSRVIESIWIGVNDHNPQRRVPNVGWVEYHIPEDVMMNDRMHLTREQVKELIPILQEFVDTGNI